MVWTDTDSDGRFTVDGLPGGAIEIEVGGEGYIGEKVELELGTRESVSGIKVPLKLGLTIAGRVTDADSGLPIRGVSIDADSVNGGGPGSHAFTRTGADGRYTLGGLAPGTYQIRAGRENPVYVQEYFDDQLNSNTAEFVTVSAAQGREGIDLALSVGATISGTVADGDTGLPIAGMDLWAGPAGGEQLSWTRTAGDGSYTLRGIPAGFIEVYVSGQGYVGVGNTLSVAAGETVTGFDF